MFYISNMKNHAETTLLMDSVMIIPYETKQRLSAADPKKKAGLRIKIVSFLNKKTVRCFVSAEIIPFLTPHVYYPEEPDIYTYIYII